MRKINEILDTRIKNISKKKQGAETHYYFDIGANNDINPNPMEITYDVWFKKPHNKTVITKIRNIPMKVSSSTLMFNNNVTGMSSFEQRGLQNVNMSIIFSTVARIIIRYMERSTAQAIDFTAAHSQLHRAYKILSREAARKGDLVWVNESDTPHEYCLVRKSLYEKFLQIIGEK